MREYSAEDAVVAFIDILGASAEMKKDPKKALNVVHNAYDDALAIYKTVFKDHRDEVRIRIFSDNIVVSCSCERLGLEKAVYSIVILSALIQEKLLHYSVLSRGGIARGDFFSDEIMIWGNALVNAYNLESTIAIYPRIVIHPDLIAEIKYFTRVANGERDSLFSWIAQDLDGLCYVDYFNNFSLMKDPSLLLLVFMEDNEQRKINNLSNLKVVQKIIWHGNYLSRKMNELIQRQETKNNTCKV